MSNGSFFIQDAFNSVGVAFVSLGDRLDQLNRALRTTDLEGIRRSRIKLVYSLSVFNDRMTAYPDQARQYKDGATMRNNRAKRLLKAADERLRQGLVEVKAQNKDATVGQNVVEWLFGKILGN